jgi:ATPase subunit of ABC transporter with duplicated ATPase domains
MDGEHIALVGANGAGKSTFLKLISGTLLPDEGSIDRHADLTIGMIEQYQHFKESDTVYSVMQSAFQDLFDAEKKMNDLAGRMAKPDVPDAVLDTYGRLQDKLISHDFYTVDARIKEMADGLGLTAIGLHTPVKRMSGGQITKLCLARLLLEAPNMLLLDEPTNYLDTGHIDWLTSYLKAYPHAFVVVSHDTKFLNGIADFVCHLENRDLVRYVGDYDEFLRQHEARREQQQIAFRQQQHEIRKLETYIQKNKARAATAKQAKSREKQLKKIERIQPPGKIRKPRFQFKVSQEPVRLIFSMEQVRIGYEEPLLPPVDFRLKRGEKVAITGHNGIGKTTFLKTMLGMLPPLSGYVQQGDRVLPGYFAQQSDRPDKTPLDWMMDRFPDTPQQVLRTHLAQCGVFAEHMHRPMATLSGGEETKVRLSWLMMKTSNVLILDEPTNHLDTEAKQALRSALADYEGTVVLVSHERTFYESWVTKTWDIESWSDEMWHKRSGRRP